MPSTQQVAHARAQLLRFVRVSALALVVQLLAAGGTWPGWSGLWSLLAGAAEAGLRQVLPVRPLPGRIDSVLSPPSGPPPGSGG